MSLSVSVVAVLFMPGGKTFLCSVTRASCCLFCCFLIHPLSTCGVFSVTAWGQGPSTSLGVVVDAKNITLPAGSKAVLPCHSPRMVWTRDRLKDRQRVVHWDLARNSPEYSVERILDMSPGVRQRVYNQYNKGRISLSDSAFSDGNFSLIINSETSCSSPETSQNISPMDL